MKTRLWLLLVAMVLPGCGSQPPSEVSVSAPLIASVAKTVTVPVKRVCPDKTHWTDDQMDALARALAPVPPNNPLWYLEKDWQKMRDEDDACKNSAAP